MRMFGGLSILPEELVGSLRRGSCELLREDWGRGVVSRWLDWFRWRTERGIGFKNGRLEQRALGCFEV